MKTLLFLMLLLQIIYPQQKSQLEEYLARSAASLYENTQDTESFFKKLFQESAATSLDTSEILYFDITFSNKPEYNISAGQLNINFNYIIADKFCNNSNRNGILLLESMERIPPARKQPEKVNKILFILLPDKCSTTRFYNSKNEMFCDNKKSYNIGYEEGTSLAENLNIRIGVQLIPSSRIDYYDKLIPAEINFPVETSLKEYVLRCCIRSIVFIQGDEIVENYVSLK
jgi:hypothetical protein